MEKGEDPATREAGGMCDRFLTFLARNLTMSKTTKSISDGPKNSAAAAGQPPAEMGEKDGEEDDEFAIPIERAEFDDFEFGGGHGDATILEESAAATTTATRDIPDEPVTGAAAAAADDADPVAAEPAPAAAVEETKVRKSVTIKEDRPEQEGGGTSSAKTTATVERKRSSLFKKRQASSSAAGDEQQRAPRRSGLRPRMPPALRVPSNINERSSTYIEERRKSFGRGGKPAPDK